ncbi:MAG: hypothetical protein IT440_09540, partial [Phycisphaeraceae bacterium]|nr:hypothetical protein [Phycisphaeraceae bacterium]
MTTLTTELDDCSLLQQKQRQKQYLAAVRDANHPRFSADGRWIDSGYLPGIRERMWQCLALLDGESRHIELANRILETSTDDGGDFNAFFSLWLLRLFEDRLSPASKRLLTDIAQAHLDHVWDHIHRYTENCAALNVFTLTEAAHRGLGGQRHMLRARERMEVFACERRHHGFSREFASLNYMPVFLTGIAVVRQFSDDAAIREMAAEVEQSIWRELADCWHPLLQFSTGPSGRSGTFDSIGVSRGQRGLVWTALGESVSPSPMDFGLFAEPSKCPMSLYHVAFVQSGGVAWFASPSFHIRPETVRQFHEKSYPCTHRGTAPLAAFRMSQAVESSCDVNRLGGWRAGDAAYLPGSLLRPGGVTAISNHMQPEYGVGAASRLVFGMSDSFRAVWRRRQPVRGLADIRSCYCRFVMNDAVEQRLGAEDFSSLLLEQGRGGAMQSGPLSVMCYAGEDMATKQTTRLRTCVVVPCLHGDMDETWIGDQSCQDHAGES